MSCKIKHCRKLPKGNKTICDSCSIRNFKKNNPEKYAYFVLRNNAKRRGKVFTISFGYFKQFAVNTEYMAGKGITKYGLHIDRKKEELGYIEGNLQVLTNTENVKKYIRYSYDQNGKPENYKIVKSVVLDDTETPF